MSKYKRPNLWGSGDPILLANAVLSRPLMQEQTAMDIARVAVVEKTELAMKFYDLLQFGVCVFSILAAGLWLRSAATTLPNLAENLRWDGTGPFPDALKEQSRWSAAGAACAGLAALSQSLSVVVRYLGSS